MWLVKRVNLYYQTKQIKQIVMIIIENIFGLVIKEKRESLHLSHKQMAEYIPASAKTIFNIEHGYRNASAKNRDSIKGFLFKDDEEYNLAEAKLNANPTRKKATNYPHYSECFNPVISQSIDENEKRNKIVF
jgi:DNA-binding XRE family transcriptional regulator